MSIRRIAILAAAAALIVSTPAFAQVQSQGQAKPPETKPEAKPEAKPDAKATPATLAGRWNVNIQTGTAEMQSVLDLKTDAKDAKKVAGTITSPQGEAPLEGTVVEGKLTFSISINSNGADLSITFVGTQQKDGTLAGTLSFGQGDMTWTAVKEKK